MGGANDFRPQGFVSVEQSEREIAHLSSPAVMAAAARAYSNDPELQASASRQREQAARGEGVISATEARQFFAAEATVPHTRMFISEPVDPLEFRRGVADVVRGMGEGREGLQGPTLGKQIETGEGVAE